MTADHACPNCGVPVPLPLLLCPACREAGWSDGPHHLSGDELTLYLELRRGERHAVPRGWWLGDEGQERGAALLRWDLRCELGATTREAVLARATMETILRARLLGWFQNRDRALSIWEAFDLALPDLALRPWELPTQVPRHFWEQGGDAARAEAMRWWLERMGLTAREALAQVERYQAGLQRQLTEVGLSELLHDRSLRALLRLVDPSIPVERPPSARGRRREEATLACPRCGQCLRRLAPHLTAAHPELSREEREALLASHGHLSPASLARYQAVGRAPLGDVARWRQAALAFPASWWPATERGVALVLTDGPDGARLLLTPDAQSPRRLHPNGRWLELRMPRQVRAALAGAPVERGEGGLRVGPLGQEAVAAVQRWIDWMFPKQV